MKINSQMFPDYIFFKWTHKTVHSQNLLASVYVLKLAKLHIDKYRNQKKKKKFIFTFSQGAVGFPQGGTINHYRKSWVKDFKESKDYYCSLSHSHRQHDIAQRAESVVSWLQSLYLIYLYLSIFSLVHSTTASEGCQTHSLSGTTNAPVPPSPPCW